MGYKPQLKVGEKIFHFGEARNHNMSQVTDEYDWIIWLDADDVFRGREKLKKVVEFMHDKGIEAGFFNYLYQVEFDNDGNMQVVIEHLRERVVKRGLYHWVAPIHETLIEKKPTVKQDIADCDVLHLSNDERRNSALGRNIRALENAIYLNKGEDPRTVYYLAKALVDLARFKDLDNNYHQPGS